MNRRDAEYLSERIEETDRCVVVTGLRSHGRSYEISCVDTRTGIPFVVRSIEEWTERVVLAAVALD